MHGEIIEFIELFRANTALSCSCDGLEMTKELEKYMNARSTRTTATTNV